MAGIQKETTSTILSSPLTSQRAINILRENGFQVFSCWDSLARELEVPLDYRRQLKHRAFATEDYTLALEETLDYWISNNTSHSWKNLLMAVEKTDEKATAERLRKLFNLSDLTGSSSNIKSPPALTGEAKVLKSFLSIQDHLQPLLVLSISDFASKCFSKNLISMQLYEKQFNQTSSTDSERTGYLIYLIIKRAEQLETSGKWREAREVIRGFGETVYGVDSVLRRVGTEIMSSDDSQSLLAKQELIKPSIQSSLLTIAVKLMSVDIITDEEYDTITDPDSNQSKRHLIEIFRTLRELIKQDSSKYQVFLQVLKEMGPPISTAAMKYAKC